MAPAIGFATWIGMTRTMVRIELDQLERCVAEMHEALAGQATDFQRYVDARAASMDPDARDEWYEWNSDRHWELSEVFPRIVRHSIFVTAYGFLEQTLLALCRHLEREHHHPVALADLKGEGIELARTYLKKVHGITFPDQSVEWNRLSWYRKVRNCLVHNDGRIPSGGKGQPIRDFFSANSALGSVDRLGGISLTPAASDDIIAMIRVFLDQLLSLIKPARHRDRR
jgi:hypothetical protein